MSLTSVSVCSEQSNPKWENFKHLVSVLKERNVVLNSVSIQYDCKSVSYSYNSVDDFATCLGKEISKFQVVLYFKERQEIQLLNVGFGYVQISSRYLEDVLKIEEILGILGLTKAKEKNPITKLEKKVFIAYHFDEDGEYCASRVLTFLGLLGFSVLTGKAYSPQSVRDKVKERMDRQDVVVAIHTKGNDDTWITQETVLGAVKKPLIILKQKDAAFNPGILSDHEYVEFDGTNIQSTFIPILEGLKDLGFAF